MKNDQAVEILSQVGRALTSLVQRVPAPGGTLHISTTQLREGCYVDWEPSVVARAITHVRALAAMLEITRKAGLHVEYDQGVFSLTRRPS